MAPTLEEVTSKTEVFEIDPKKQAEKKLAEQEPEPKSATESTEADSTEKVTAEKEPVSGDAKDDQKKETMEEKIEDASADKEPKNDIVTKDDKMKDEKVEVHVEPKTGVSFPVRLDNGMQLNSVGIRNKKILGIGIKIYAFGMFADNEKLKEVLKVKIGKAPAKPTKEMYQVVIDSDVGMMVRLVIVFGQLTMNMVKKNFDEGLGASIKKLNGGRKNDELTNMVMGEASDNIKLSAGSLIEITRLPGNILQTKVKDEVVSKVESELLCRAYFNMYLGDDAFDKDAKERFGSSLLAMF